MFYPYCSKLVQVSGISESLLMKDENEGMMTDIKLCSFELKALLLMVIKTTFTFVGHSFAVGITLKQNFVN